MKKTLNRCLFGLVICLPLLSYAGDSLPNPSLKAPGFLTDYSILQPVSDPESTTQVYVYNNPQAKRSDYNGLIIDPIILYQTATESGITDQQIAAAKTEITNDVESSLAAKISLVKTPAAAVARLTIAITGAMLEGDGFKPRNLIPIQAVIKIASTATGYANKRPVLVIETKIVDSKTNKLLGTSVTTISGEKFRSDAATPEAFVKLAQVWLNDSIKYATLSKP